MSDEAILLSVPRVCALSGAGRSLIWSQIRAGVIPTVRIGKRVLIPRSYLDNLIKQAEAGVAAAPMRDHPGATPRES